MLQLLAAAFVLTSLPVIAEPVSGQARVIDGNTLRIEQQVFRLHGIDAPERAQLCAVRWQCGKAAADTLRNLTSKAPVVCESRWRDGQGRIIATCRTGETDLGAELVRRGLALALKDGVYSELEATAKNRRSGLWAGKFQNPAEYRADRGIRIPGATPEAAPSRPEQPIERPATDPDAPSVASKGTGGILFDPMEVTLID